MKSYFIATQCGYVSAKCTVHRENSDQSYKKQIVIACQFLTYKVNLNILVLNLPDVGTSNTPTVYKCKASSYFESNFDH